MSKRKPLSPFQAAGLVIMLLFFAGVAIAVLFTGKRWGDKKISTRAKARLAVATQAADKASQLTGLDPELILAVMWRESSYRADALGKAGEIGLMQIMPGTAAEWARKTGQTGFETRDLYDPEVNARAGAWYLVEGLELWSHMPDPLPYSLARYNAGQSRVVKWHQAAGRDGDFIEHIGIPSTRRYVLDILERYRGP